jgi:hypothetical protein
MNFQVGDSGEITRLVVVPSHAVYYGSKTEEPLRDENWYLQSFQSGEPPYYIEHIKYAVELADSAVNSLLVFSGGQTRLEAGPKSEAQSYWTLAAQHDWWGRSSMRDRSTTEEFARDSFENLLFGICRFKEFLGHYPASIDVVGWTFKAERFELHCAAINWPRERGVYRYHPVNNPINLDGAVKGERRAIAEFRDDPFGTETELSQKRANRNPFRRQAPYLVSCHEISNLLSHRSRNGKVFNGVLPWA